jgi:hypothetical protein
MVELAGEFEDQELREAFLRNALAIIHRNIFLFAEMRLPL